MVIKGALSFLSKGYVLFLGKLSLKGMYKSETHRNVRQGQVVILFRLFNKLHQIILQEVLEYLLSLLLILTHSHLKVLQSFQDKAPSIAVQFQGIQSVRRVSIEAGRSFQEYSIDLCKVIRTGVIELEADYPGKYKF